MRAGEILAVEKLFFCAYERRSKIVYGDVELKFD